MSTSRLVSRSLLQSQGWVVMLAAAALAPLAGAATASAATIVQDVYVNDFDGVSPLTGWSLSEEGPDTVNPDSPDIQVVSDPTGSGRVNVLQLDDDPDDVVAQTPTFSGLYDGTGLPFLLISYDRYKPVEGNVNVGQADAITIRTPGGSSVSGARWSVSTSSRLNDGSSQVAGANYPEGVWVNHFYVINLNDLTYNGYITEVVSGNVIQIAENLAIPYTGPVTGFNEIEFLTFSTFGDDGIDNQRVFYDNLVVQASNVPEPASLGLILAGAALIVPRRHR